MASMTSMTSSSPVAKQMLSANCDTRMKLGILSQNCVKIDILIGETYLIHVYLVGFNPPPILGRSKPILKGVSDQNSLVNCTRMVL